MRHGWVTWAWTLLLVVGLTGCATKPIAPPPSFAAPILRPPVIALPKPEPMPAPPARIPAVIKARVVIDPGHGGKDPGAQISRLDEKDINLSVAKLVASKLSARGITVVLTRNSDSFIELADRAAAGRGADLFASVHVDSNPSPEKIGHTVLTPQSGDPKATRAARYIDQRMSAAGSPSHMVRMDTRGLAVFRMAQCPAVLVELGFLTNRTEAAALASPAYHERLATGIANGILDYLSTRR